MSKIVIFGGSGFIGTHLSRQLLEAGEKIIVIDLQPTRYVHQNLEFVKGDVRDISNVEINGEISRVYNFAAIHTTPGHPTHEYYETNVAGANEVCKFAEKYGVEDIVFTSSISVYGPDEEQKDENSPLTPNSAYGYSKMLAEKIHRAWKERDGNRSLNRIERFSVDRFESKLSDLLG